MAAKSPFDFSEAMKMFDPEQFSKMFNPEAMMSVFGNAQLPGVNFQEVFEKNRGNMEAMVAANKAAAEAYREFYEMQMSIFKTLTKSAEEHARSLGQPQNPETMQRQSQAVQASVEKGFALMAELAETARESNKATYALIQKRVDEAVEDIKKI